MMMIVLYCTETNGAKCYGGKNPDTHRETLDLQVRRGYEAPFLSGDRPGRLPLWPWTLKGVTKLRFPGSRSGKLLSERRLGSV